MEDLNRWVERCPLEMFKGLMIEKQLITKDQYNSIVDEIDTEMDRCIKAARDAPLPSTEELLQHIYHERD